MYCQKFEAPDIRNTAVHAQNTSHTPEIIVKLIQTIHLVAAAEAIAFARHLKVDLAQFYSLVNDAAGASSMFKTIGAKVMGIEPDMTTTSYDKLSDVIEDLSSAVQVARDSLCPLYLSNAALGILLVAKRRGWGSEGPESVIKYYEGRDT